MDFRWESLVLMLGTGIFDLNTYVERTTFQVKLGKMSLLSTIVLISEGLCVPFCLYNVYFRISLLKLILQKIKNLWCRQGKPNKILDWPLPSILWILRWIQVDGSSIVSLSRAWVYKSKAICGHCWRQLNSCVGSVATPLGYASFSLSWFPCHPIEERISKAWHGLQDPYWCYVTLLLYVVQSSFQLYYLYH